MPDRIRVFDTVVLSNFLLSGGLQVLVDRYRGTGRITWQVYDEISAGMPEYPALKAIRKLLDDKVFRLIALTRVEHDRFLALIGHLGKGEASCIAVGQTRNGTVLTDDRAARMICNHLKVPFSGTIGMLKAAFLDGQIDLEGADSLLSAMIQRGFYSPVSRIADII